MVNMVDMNKKITRTLFATYFLAVSLTESPLLSHAEESPAPQSQLTQNDSGLREPGTAKDLGGPLSENPAYQHVAVNLDTDGLLYLYFSAEQTWRALEKKLESIREMAVADPSLSQNEKNGLRKNFDLGFRLILNSGLPEVKAFGLSSREIGPGLFLNKAYAYLPERSGFLWDSLGKAPHVFPFIKMIPENTEGFAIFDFDLGLLWKAVSEELAGSEVPEVMKWQQLFSQQVQAFTGLDLDDLLGSLGDQVGVIVTFNRKTMVKIPLGNEQYAMPEPAAALVWKVRNDKLFDRLDVLLATSSKVAKLDEPDLRLRVLEGSEVMTYLTPTLARHGDFLIISSSEMLVRALMDTESGKAQGIKYSSEFETLASGMPEKGNSVAYVSKRLQKTVADIQMRLSHFQESGSPLTRALTAKLSRLSEDAAGYIVSGATQDGWLTTEKTTRDANEFLGEFLTIPVCYLAVAAVDEIKRTRENEH